MEKESKSTPGREQDVSKEPTSHKNFEVNMTILEKEYGDTINHFGYTKDNVGDCLISPRTYGALFFMQFHPPTSKCRITVDYIDTDSIMVIDFDPKYPRSMTRFIHAQKQRETLGQ